MTNTELYTEFREECLDRVTVDRDEFCKRIKKLKKGAIIEQDKGGYRLYSKLSGALDREQEQDAPYVLEIDPAARVRFEGSFSEYEDLLKEINKNRIGHYDVKVYSKLQDGNADSDFFIMDVYYQMI